MNRTNPSPFANHSQWNAVKEVCLRLRQNGYIALLAGGCVRDMLMKREPHDFDIATNATPDQASLLFPTALTIGKAFGVTIVPMTTKTGSFHLEVATFREDLNYQDGRRPEGVKFSTPEADALRRDFTINALFYDPETGQILDFVDGQADIKRRLIRAVGEPERRFNEDKLRLLRAVRFSAQLGFAIESNTMNAIKSHAAGVSVVSRERVRDELIKLLASTDPVRGLELLISTDLLVGAFKESAGFILRDPEAWLKRFSYVIKQTQAKQMNPSLEVLISMFFAPVFGAAMRDLNVISEKDFREFHLKSLRLDNRQADAIIFGLSRCRDFLQPSTLRRGELALLLSHPDAGLALNIAEIFENTDGLEAESDRMILIDDVRKVFLPDGTLPPPFLNGGDVKMSGIKPGPKMGELLHEAYLGQLEGTFTTRAMAIAWLAKMAK